MSGALSSGNFFGAGGYKSAQDFLDAIAGGVVAPGSTTGGTNALLTLASTVGADKTARASAAAGNDYVVFGLGANGTVYAVTLTAAMLSHSSSKVVVNYVGTSNATKLDLNDIKIVAVADGITATDIVIV